MDKTYKPENIEQRLYEFWETSGYFKPNNDITKDSYCIMIPPPNITGDLHMGHALQHTIMDTLIRYQRMQGKNTLWQTGTDHAGIATQMIVERKIFAEEGKTRYDYGRDAFLDKIYQWKTISVNYINYQMRRLGNSVDWSRERFTMDNGLSRAVKEVFVRLYQENLIYRGKRLVNWDLKLQTAISDLEVENRDSKGLMWYLRYYIADGAHTIKGCNYIVVATTRPETILGDTGIAVNPKDSRYKNLIGQFIVLPITNRRVPIIGDEKVRINKGTGCVKITPAHDFNDYDIGKRHLLPMINILTFDGKIRHKAEVFDTKGNMIELSSKYIPANFRGLERFAARQAIVEELKHRRLIVEVREHDLKIPYGDRSGIIIEPMLTDQWYMRTAKLAKAAVSAVENNKIQFIPQKYKNMYFSWMKDTCNIHDWCISRQLWWGHRIPAWYDTENKIYVGHSEREVRKQYELSDNVTLYQDNDVLDTWFSSGLWTFSTLGWPDSNDELHVFHPTNVLVSGFDIIFFWIARMIMLTMHFIKNKNSEPQVPFNTVYITGLVRDEKGQKMSKSKGNIIDPLDLIDGISLEDLIKKRTDNMMQPQLANLIRKRTKKQFPTGIKSYGADALRLTLLALSSTSRDINLDLKRLNGYCNFCNKLWNASRFVLINTENYDCGFNGGEQILSLADRWILAKLNQAIKEFREALDSFRFDLATGILYDFIWNQFCDWYLELTKPIISKGLDAELRGTRHTLVIVLESLLRLAHPVIPFITEAIWQQIKNIMGKLNETIMLQPFPFYDSTLLKYNDAIADLEWIKQAIVAVRKIRVETGIKPSVALTVMIRCSTPSVERILQENLSLILILANLNSINVLSANKEVPVSITQCIDNAEILIPMAGLINRDVELERLSEKIARTRSEIDLLAAKLCNKNFVSRAPKIVVYKERRKLQAYQQYILKLLEQKATVAKL